jgi:hypothetical protein
MTIESFDVSAKAEQPVENLPEVEQENNSVHEHEMTVNESIELELKLGNTTKSYEVTLVKLDEDADEITQTLTDPITRSTFKPDEYVARIKDIQEIDDPDYTGDTYKLESLEYITKHKITPKN